MSFEYLQFFKAYEKFGIEGAKTLENLFDRMIQENRNTKWLQAEMRSRGFGYRYQDMLEDIRGLRFIERNKDYKPEGKYNSLQLYYEKIEPFREQMGLTYNEAMKIYRDFKAGRFDYYTPEELDEILDYYDQYELEEETP